MNGFRRGGDIVKDARRRVRALDNAAWRSVGWPFSARLEAELKRELAPTHVLRGRDWFAVAKASTSDDVLFVSREGPAALIHLTWQKETTPDWPAATLFADISAALEALKSWRDAQDAPDGLPPEMICPGCGANWSANKWGADCGLCGGFALYRDCPVCGGACGAIWQRAIQDSIGAGEPLIIGQCARKGGA